MGEEETAGLRRIGAVVARHTNYSGIFKLFFLRLDGHFQIRFF
jgi:hypothetical protein